MNFRFLIIFLILSACINSTGFKEEPTGKNAKKIGLERNGVTLKFYNINKINTSILPKVEQVKKKLIKNLMN